MRSKISKTDVKIFKLVSSQPDRWFTANDVADSLKSDGRNVRLHLAYLVENGVLEKFDDAKAHHYRWLAISKHAQEYHAKLLEAAKIFSGK